jgi:K+-transporting ATPase ATPase C chain
VAAARGLPVEEVLALVEAHTAGRTAGILGETRVDVLALNLALDARR